MTTDDIEIELARVRGQLRHALEDRQRQGEEIERLKRRVEWLEQQQRRQLDLEWPRNPETCD